MNALDLSNPTPVVHDVVRTKKAQDDHVSSSNIDSQDIYDLISNIKDPEHPYTLEQLKVTEEHKIWVQELHHFLHIKIEFTPTVPHCTLATTIGLCIREKLRRELPRFFKLDIYVTPGSHSTEFEINKQINDKERVSAAMENPFLRPIIEECIKLPD